MKCSCVFRLHLMVWCFEKVRWAPMSRKVRGAVCRC